MPDWRYEIGTRGNKVSVFSFCQGAIYGTMHMSTNV